jgi:predicted nucleic acid-binding protein
VRIFCDTSVLVRAFLKNHPDNERAAEVVRRVKTGEDIGFVAAHSLAETYAVLTGMPAKPRITPTAAYSLISEDVVRYFKLIMLTPSDYLRVLQQLQTRDLTGGIIYDALIQECARMSAPERFYTFNPGDFRRLAPEWSEIIREP